MKKIFKQKIPGSDMPIQDPLVTAEASWVKGQIDEIHVDNLTTTPRPYADGIREWLREIIDSWPNIPTK